jgi:glucose/arabinose dehydrogenase
MPAGSRWQPAMARLCKFIIASALLTLVVTGGSVARAAELELEGEAALKSKIDLPDGWTFSVYATGLGSPRLMQLAPNGDLIVSLSRSGVIARLTADQDGDGHADGVTALARGLNLPHGLWLEDGTLYVAEEGQVTRYRFDGTVLSDPVRVAAGLPSGGRHRSRTLKRGPDGRLYLSIGSSCNVCEENDDRRAVLLTIGNDGTLSIHARGLRNTVGFDWQPGTGILYGVDNGRDGLGDTVPPEELNVIIEGGHFGWPYRFGQNEPDPELGARMPKTLDPVPPVLEFTAHVAPLSISFLEASNDSNLKAAALVAKHGSWNRSAPAGYEITSLHWGDDGRIEEQPFMTGCLDNGTVHCRPVDVLEAPDGNLFVSDDFTGAIYRLTYKPLQ